jgi:hypothetical protein
MNNLFNYKKQQSGKLDENLTYNKKLDILYYRENIILKFNFTREYFGDNQTILSKIDMVEEDVYCIKVLETYSSSSDDNFMKDRTAINVYVLIHGNLHKLT